MTSGPLPGQQTPSAANEQPETTGRRLYYSPTMIIKYIPGIDITCFPSYNYVPYMI